MLQQLAHIKTILVFVLLIWLAFFFTPVFQLHRFGIVPRTEFGLFGVFFAPFLHGNYMHLFTNTVGLLTFGVVFALIEGRHTASVIGFIIIVGGLLTWAMGRTALHIGASGVVFGLFGYLAFLGFFHKRFLYLMVSFTTLLLFGAMIFGVLPNQKGVSFESHLFGFIAGALAAKLKP